MGTAKRGGNKLMAAETPNFKLKKPDRTDFVNIKEQLSDNMDIIDTEIKEAQEKADLAFQSASNGKTLIKNAITGVDPEVTIPTDATFQQLADAIGQIETGVNTDDATATAEHILAGMTAYIKEIKVTGKMINRSGTTHMADSFYADTGYVILKPPIGYYDGVGGSSVRQNEPNLRSANIRGGVSIFGVQGNTNVVDTSDGVLDANLMVQGLSGYSKGSKSVGTMPNRLSGNDVLAEGYAVNGTSLYLRPPSRNAFNGGSVYKNEPNLIPANILSGKSIFGVAGSVIAGKKFASGTTVSSNTVDLFKTSSGDASKGFIRMSSLNLTFVPRIIYYYDTSEPDYYTNIYVRDGVGGSVGGIKFVVTSITCRSYSASNPHEYLYVPSGFNKNYTWFAWE